MDFQQAVFAFDDPVEFLNFHLQERQKRDPRFSLRAWARQLGYENPSYLSHVLKRERRLKIDLASKLAEDLGLPPKARRYFELSVLSCGADTQIERDTYTKLMKALRPRKLRTVSKVSLEYFSMISDWYHVAIMALTTTKGFRPEEHFIYERLGRSVEKRSIRSAIDRLIRLGFLERVAGGIQLSLNGELRTDPKVTDSAMQRFHSQLAEKALKALAQPACERDFQGTTLCFTPERIEEAREILREAHSRIAALSEKNGATEVYHLNTQFFRLTESSQTGMLQ